MQQVCTSLYVCDCRFFEDYKKNENKEVKIDDFLNNVEAKKAIKESMVSRCQPVMLCHGYTVSWIHRVMGTPCHGYTVSWIHRVMETLCVTFHIGQSCLPDSLRMLHSACRLPTLTYMFPSDPDQAAIQI